ncbi:hypothetical protein PVAP13_8NG213612 [Panicum virgatum]|uniref:Uncharacterized protein n=1 Tax=Panicum virgatum TaxID=38727 RepID=A0A8T0P9G4_PANVG|nr:hypothetical protein PVAP13_8NG213612 [Panicum virgatum]
MFISSPPLSRFPLSSLLRSTHGCSYRFHRDFARWVPLSHSHPPAISGSGRGLEEGSAGLKQGEKGGGRGSAETRPRVPLSHHASTSDFWIPSWVGGRHLRGLKRWRRGRGRGGSTETRQRCYTFFSRWFSTLFRVLCLVEVIDVHFQNPARDPLVLMEGGTESCRPDQILEET